MDEIRLTVQEPEPINLKTEQIATGPYYLPAVSDEGVISWTNNGGLPNPESRSIKGSQGDTGEQGPAGVDGVSPTIGVTDITGGHRVTITDADGVQSFDVMDGADAPAPDLTPYAKNAMIDTVQASAVAASNYVVGDTFILSDKLYKVDAAIATGEQIVPGEGGNCHETTVDTEIQAAGSKIKSIYGMNGSSSIKRYELIPDANGAINLPFATTSTYGSSEAGIMNVSHASGFSLGGISAAPTLWTPDTPNDRIENRDKTGSIIPCVITNTKIDYVLRRTMCDGVGSAWTDAERLAALLRMGCTVDENGYVKWTAQRTAE